MAIPHKETGDQLSAVEVNEIVNRLPYNYVFDNVSDMRAYTGFSNGDFVLWRGYYTPGDGGGNSGEYHTTWAYPHDGGTVFGLNSGGSVVADIHNREVNFFQFGAIDNGTNTIFANDSTEAIQAALRSPYHVRGSAGYFYITDTLHIDQTQHVELLGEGSAEYNDILVGVGNTTRIYSDLNIDYFRVETQGVKITGGFLDSSQALVHNKAFVYMDVSKGTHKTTLDIKVAGNKDTLATVGNGAIGVDYDFVEAGWEHATSSFDYIKINAIYCGMAVRITDKYNSQWHPYISINMNTLYCKQMAVFGTATDVKLYADAQCGAWLPIEEKDKAQIYIGANARIEIEVNFSDLSPGGTTSGKWHAKTGIENHSKNCTLIGKSYAQINFGNIIDGDYPYSNNLGYFYNVDRFSMLSSNKIGISSSHISDLHNGLVGTDKRNAITLVGYDGTGFDFDTQLAPASTYSTPVDSDISFTRINTLFDKITPLVTSGTYPIDASSTRFTELYIPESKNWKYFDMILHTTRMNFDRIQIIKTSSPPQMAYLSNLTENERSTGSTFSVKYTFPSTSPGGLIIRLIGNSAASSGTSTGFYFQDVAAYAQNAIPPVISIAGGERIYGDLQLGASGETVISIRDMYNRIVALENP